MADETGRPTMLLRYMHLIPFHEGICSLFVADDDKRVNEPCYSSCVSPWHRDLIVLSVMGS